MPATKNMDGLSVFSIDRDECVDLAIVFETIRRGDGIRVYRPYSDMTKFEPGVWSFHNGDDSISYGRCLCYGMHYQPLRVVSYIQ